MWSVMYIYNMSKRYSIAAARSNLPAIVKQAEAGLEIELTRRGKPVAIVVSPREIERRRSDDVRFSHAYEKFLKKHSLEEIGIDEDFFRAARANAKGREVSI